MYYMETKILNKPDNENKNKKIENNIGYNGENPSETRESQQQKCRNPIPIADNQS